MEQLEQRVVLAVFAYDFSENDGGFTTRGFFGEGPWRYTGNDWQPVVLQTAPSDTKLISPILTAEADTVSFSMEHSYNLAQRPAAGRTPPIFFVDGGNLQVSINGGGFQVVVPEGDYPRDGREPISCSQLTALMNGGCWGGNSGGTVTDTASIELSEGDTVQFRLVIAFGLEGHEPNPNWQVFSITVDTEGGGGGGGGGTTEAAVVGRHTFYNGSFFDAPPPGDAAADPADDAAIATDKVPLLPGATATFDNYTSSSAGINGIIVDVMDLASEPTVETVDSFFAFAVGNDSTPDDWEAAPAPSGIEVRAGEGVDGSTRVTLVWEDNAIQNEWLQTTVLANESTGLPAADVFYFGNAIGDSGNSTTDTSVNAQDIGGARDNPHNFLNRALVDDAFDYNRDSLVNAQDIGVARDNPTNFLSDVELITVPAAAPTAAGLGRPVESLDQLPIPRLDRVVPGGSSRLSQFSTAGERDRLTSPLLILPDSQHVDEVYSQRAEHSIDTDDETPSPFDWASPVLEEELSEMLSGA